jgi:hypothetical protein
LESVSSSTIHRDSVLEVLKILRNAPLRKELVSLPLRYLNSAVNLANQAYVDGTVVGTVAIQD